jgi:hypothetical protein
MRDVTVLLTRFSLPHQVWKTRTTEEYDAWLEIRLELMERFTVPSVRNLFVKPDLWLIFVGQHKPEILARVKKIAQQSRAKVVLVAYEGLTLPESIAGALSGEFELPIRLCTVRLDSDDVIASSYFAAINAVLGEVNIDNDFAISFPGGSVYDATTDKFSYLSYPDNAFLAHVELVHDWTTLKSVFREMHTILLKELKDTIYRRSNHPMWSAVVHEHNLANQSLLLGLCLTFNENDLLRRKFGIGMPD